MTACAIHISDLHRGHSRGARARRRARDTLSRARARARHRERRSLEPRPPGRARGGAGAARPAAGPRARGPGQPRHPVHAARRASPAPGSASRRSSARPIQSSGLATAVVCGLNSARPWRHQGGRLDAAPPRVVAAVLADAPARRATIVVCHHHLAGAPWRARASSRSSTATRRCRLSPRRGAELVLGGHIHQSTAVERHAFEARPTTAARRSSSPPRPASAGPARTGSARPTGSTSFAGHSRRSRSRPRIWRDGRFRSPQATLPRTSRH